MRAGWVLICKRGMGACWVGADQQWDKGVCLVDADQQGRHGSNLHRDGTRAVQEQVLHSVSCMQ